jgi:hypothetical protein
METLGSRKIASILDGDSRFSTVTNHLVRSTPGVAVSTYPDPRAVRAS